MPTFSYMKMKLLLASKAGFPLLLPRHSYVNPTNIFADKKSSISNLEWPYCSVVIIYIYIFCSLGPLPIKYIFKKR